ncbi:DUF418 domain-containing protein [Gordonia sp. CPCC 205333]|uniref:DUF418 domain-containing protein n=1 Tax=Gordonia sp. CPCC 205333 TaxID=3140790 RepID=UPI003AF341D3
MKPQTTEDKPVRLHGIDAARAVAIVGMFAVHIFTFGDVRWADPLTYTSLVVGHAAPTFVMLAGISIALYTGGPTPVTGDELVHARHTLLVRACLIGLLGGILQMIGSPVTIILLVYGFLFVVSLPLLTVSPRRLLRAAVVLAIVMPVAMPLLHAAVGAWGMSYYVLPEILFNGGYPALTWCCYFLVGLALGRIELSDEHVVNTLIVRGAVIAAAAYVSAAAVSPIRTALDPDGTAPSPARFQAPLEHAGEGFLWTPANLTGLLTGGSHTSTPFDIFGSTGISLVVIGLCLKVFHSPGVLSWPLRAAGRMPLTLYTAHIVALLVLDRLWPSESGENPPWAPFSTWLAFAVVSSLGAMWWLNYHRRGPLEGWIARIAAMSAGPPNRHLVQD